MRSWLFILCVLPALAMAEGVADPGESAPEVTITKDKEVAIEEYRVGGRLYAIKVTPKVGKPYYLIDERGDGKFARQESLDSGFRPPQWILHRF